MNNELEQRAFAKLRTVLTLAEELQTVDFPLALNANQVAYDEQIIHMKRKLRRYKAQVRKLAAIVARYENDDDDEYQSMNPFIREMCVEHILKRTKK